MIKKEKAFPVKIGLEVHGYLSTAEKLFCKCAAAGEKNEKPNSRVCPICTGQPGSKPMLPNKEAVDKTIQVALVLGCKINHNKKLLWQRKHYNWPDLPKGYQNTISGAYSVPVGVNGSFKGIKIRECHLEEDPAQWNPDTGKINYNRSGAPLIEIVTEPEFASAEEVISWLKSLVHSLSYIKAVKKDAGIKADVNVSTYGKRVEIKNLNSLVNIKNAIGYEVARQEENYAKGEEQKQETLAYDASKGRTIKMREKEGQADYRFIPDPDLPVINISEKEVKKMQRELPEMPAHKLNKLLDKYKVDLKNARILAKHLELVEFFEELARQIGSNARKHVSWVTIELLRILNYNKKTLEDVDIKPQHLAELIKEVDAGNITPLKAKQIMNEFIPESFSVKKKGAVGKIEDKARIEKLCADVLGKNRKVVEDYKAGKKEALNFLVGRVMEMSERRADFQMTKECLGRMMK